MDRTLIASLGFLDPDKRESDHDLVCEYICQPEIMDKFGRFAVCYTPIPEGVRVGGHEQERILSKGQGAYRTHIGFIDCVIAFVPRHYTDEKAYIARFPHLIVAIEVKVLPVPIPDIIRQIKLYRQHYYDGVKWVVATRWRPSEADIATLLNEKIQHVFIGEKFDQWKASRNAAPSQNLLDF